MVINKLFFEKHKDKIQNVAIRLTNMGLFENVSIKIGKKSFIVSYKIIFTYEIIVKYNEVKQYLINDIYDFDALENFILSKLKKEKLNIVNRNNNKFLQNAKDNLKSKLEKDLPEEICAYECKHGKLYYNKNQVLWQYDGCSYSIKTIQLKHQDIDRFKPQIERNGEEYILCSYDYIYDEILSCLKDDYLDKILKSKINLDNRKYNKKILSRYKYLCDLHNSHSNDLNGIKNKKFSIKASFPFDKPEKCIYKTSFGNFEIKDEKIIEKLSEETIKNIELLTNKKYLSVEKFILEKFKSFSDLKIKAEGPMLISDCDITIKQNQDFKSYKYTFIDYNTSVTEFKKEFNKYFNSIVKDFKKFIKSIEIDAVNRDKDIYENFIYKDILDFVNKNESYITANATTQALRGVSVQLNAHVNLTDNCGKYKIYTNDEVLGCIDKLIFKQFIRTVQLKGTYGRFNILKRTNKPFYETTCDMKEINRKIKHNLELTDSEALYFFNCKKEDLDNNDYLNLLNLIHSKGFICIYYDEYIQLMKTSPNEVKNFIKMKIAMEEDKNVCKILKDITK